MVDDQRLIADYLAGDTKTVNQIHQWIQQVVQSRYWGLHEHWSDITQDVHRKLIETFGQSRFRLRANVRSYVYRVAQLTCIDYLRRQYRRPETETLEGELPLRDERFDPDQWAEAIDQQRLLFKLFHALPDECRRLWRSLFLDGRSYRELSEQWHISEATVRVRFHRCKQRALELYRRWTRAPVK